jgi:inner membrane protein
MPSVLSHAVVGLSLGACFYKPGIKTVWIAGAICAALPDLDVIGFSFGVHYGDFWGHRGFSHSLIFAALLAAAAALVFWVAHPVPPLQRADGLGLGLLWIYFFSATASHGFLDAFTDGGLGVAFFSPFNNRRYFFAWRPILVAPIGVTRFFSHWGLAVLRSELLWVWLPAFLFVVLVLGFRHLCAWSHAHSL